MGNPRTVVIWAAAPFLLGLIVVIVVGIVVGKRSAARTACGRSGSWRAATPMRHSSSRSAATDSMGFTNCSWSSQPSWDASSWRSSGRSQGAPTRRERRPGLRHALAHALGPEPLTPARDVGLTGPVCVAMVYAMTVDGGSAGGCILAPVSRRTSDGPQPRLPTRAPVARVDRRSATHTPRSGFGGRRFQCDICDKSTSTAAPSRKAFGHPVEVDSPASWLLGVGRRHTLNANGHLDGGLKSPSPQCRARQREIVSREQQRVILGERRSVRAAGAGAWWPRSGELRKTMGLPSVLVGGRLREGEEA